MVLSVYDILEPVDIWSVVLHLGGTCLWSPKVPNLQLSWINVPRPSRAPD